VVQTAFADFVLKLEENIVLIDGLENYAVQHLKKQSAQESNIKEAWGKLGYSSQKKIGDASRANMNLLGG
jgi:hypothetical protein